jgi:hypothetical protein
MPFIDSATEVIRTSSGLIYGGRVFISNIGSGCLHCRDVLDVQELTREGMTDAQREIHDRTYGIDRSNLGGSGPSVVTLNGVVASLATTEMMMLTTCLRPPVPYLTYRADLGIVRLNRDAVPPGCPYCGRLKSL